MYTLAVVVFIFWYKHTRRPFFSLSRSRFLGCHAMKEGELRGSAAWHPKKTAAKETSHNRKKTFWFFRLRFLRAYDSAYDSDFRILLGNKRSFDSLIQLCISIEFQLFSKLLLIKGKQGEVARSILTYSLLWHLRLILFNAVWNSRCKTFKSAYLPLVCTTRLNIKLTKIVLFR